MREDGQGNLNEHWPNKPPPAAVVAETTDDRMLVQKIELLLLGSLPLDQLANRPQAIGPIAGGNFTGLLDLGVRMLVRQAQQPLQHAHAFDAPGLDH